MNKQEILAKSREENRGMDEREQHEFGSSFGLGGIVVIVLCGLFTVVEWIRGGRPFQYTAIVLGFFSGMLWHNYIVTRKKKYLLSAIYVSICMIGAVAAVFCLN